uniref:CrTam39 n=1 Tax=Chlamydomonas reinhardtii TaxID=3055 RepID=UPI0035A3D71D
MSPGALYQLAPERLRASSRRSAAATIFRRDRMRLLRCSAAAQPGEPGEAAGPSTSGSDNSNWWASINRKTGIRGPDPAPAEEHTNGPARDIIGDRMSRRLEDINKAERQRVWDAMRVAAAHRYASGQMPAWFDPEWLQQEEAPLNAMDRMRGEQRRIEEQQQQQGEASSSDKLAMEGGGGDSGAGAGGWSGGGSGGGWWREDDPYWPLRDWGDHPMRWWTLAFAAIMAAGGLATSVATGYVEPVQAGLGAGALLALAGAAMSDARCVPGALGVKLAWAVCALIVLKEVSVGWQHKRKRRLAASAPRLELTGLAAAALCAGYMLTDMSGMGEVALPPNPGAVFKSPDVAYRASVWQKWGYGQVQMRV